MREQLMKIVRIALLLFVILSSLIVIWFLILKLTGHSPTADQIMIALLTIIIGALIGLMIQFERFRGEMRNFRMEVNLRLNHIERSFGVLAKDFKAHIRDKDAHR